MMEWNETFAVGIDAIDEQHQELFRRVNEFSEAVLSGKEKGTVDKMMTYLKSYVLSHFQDEEELMGSIDYPGLDEQVKAHDEFVDEHLDYLFDALYGDRQALHDAISFLEDWLTRHVAVEDRRIGEYFRGIQGKVG